MTRISRTIAIVLLLSAASPLIRADGDPVALILAKHAQAAGAEKIAETKTLIETRLVQIESGEYIQILYAKKPAKLRVEYLTARGRIVRVFDGTKTWGATEKRGGELRTLELEPQEDKELRNAAITNEAFTDRLLAAQAQAALIEPRENEPTADGQLLLFVTEKDQGQYRLKIDRQTGLLLAMYSTQKGRAIQYLYSKYKQIDGIANPLEIRILVDGKESRRTRLSSIRYNVELDDALFSPPPQPDAIPSNPEHLPALQYPAADSHASAQD